MRELVRDAVLLMCVAAALAACSTQRKISRIDQAEMKAGINLPARWTAATSPVDTSRQQKRDTMKVTGLDGREVLIMRAVRDEETGEMVATEQLDAAVVSARFRNVAERRGRVALEFEVRVPREMHDSRWQIRLSPQMYILGDSLRLDDIVITGADYRRAQLRGYQQYERFLSRIVTDSTEFVRIHELEVFLARNLPEVYAFRNDTSYVSDDRFASAFGVTEKEAVDHYTNVLALKWNERRKNNSDRMWRRFVKAPILTEGIRLDTVIRNLDSEFIYSYVQEIATRPKLRKVDVKLGGGIYEQDRRIYSIPVSDPLTFYISSVSAFVDDAGRYLTKVISRNAEANMSAAIDFKVGRSDIDPGLGDNAREIASIRRTLRELISNPEFGLDSITVSAWASPEGSVRSNAVLTRDRAASASSYFSSYVKHVSDSVRTERGFFLDVGADGSEGGIRGADVTQIVMRSRSGGENWQRLDDLVTVDTVLTDADKEAYFLAGEKAADQDDREKRIAGQRFYSHLREDLYPRLRTVIFNFYLHRIGMAKDTIHTTVLDSAYMAGVQAVKDRDYELALEYLAGYQDYNTAIAYVALDRNRSALAILENCPETPRTDYMLAIVHSRLGDERKAVQSYLRACEADPSLVFRGNLDPEISSLVAKYNLNLNDQ